MKFCPKCGCELQDDVMFCHKCGTKQSFDSSEPKEVKFEFNKSLDALFQKAVNDLTIASKLSDLRGNETDNRPTSELSYVQIKIKEILDRLDYEPFRSTDPVYTHQFCIGYYPQSKKNTEVKIVSDEYLGFYLGDDDNLYVKHGALFYKVEPLFWQQNGSHPSIKTASKTGMVLVGKHIIDSEIPFQTDLTNDDYQESYIQSFLDNQFIKKWFGPNQQKYLKDIMLPIEYNNEYGRVRSFKVFVPQQHDLDGKQYYGLGPDGLNSYISDYARSKNISYIRNTAYNILEYKFWMRDIYMANGIAHSHAHGSLDRRDVGIRLCINLDMKKEYEYKTYKLESEKKK